MKDNTRIYFAHSMTDYGNPYEDCSDTFLHHFLIEHHQNDFNIVNPRFVKSEPNPGEGFHSHMVRVFFPEVKESDVIIAIPEGTRFKYGEDYYSDGVSMEIEYANNIGIPTFKLPHILRAAGRENILTKMHIMMPYDEMAEYVRGISPDDLPSWDSIISQI